MLLMPAFKVGNPVKEGVLMKAHDFRREPGYFCSHGFHVSATAILRPLPATCVAEPTYRWPEEELCWKLLILCPFDFSEFSVRAYYHEQSLAEHYRSKLVVQHIVEIWGHAYASFAATASLYDRYCESVRESAKEQLLEFVKNHTRVKLQPELIVDLGTAPDLNFVGCPSTETGSHRHGNARFARV
jgi:hypothetical protein